ncbi:MAG: roadblock/LC7 domain-containing protein [Hydrococcus sp. Prado102]|jgi:hypothetical protein|nr:roadblock/LC7 domain-containing protein [Hydrococcus sp. Prado102]
MSSKVPPSNSNSSAGEQVQQQWLVRLTRIIIQLFTPPEPKSIVQSAQSDPTSIKNPIMIQASVLQNLLQNFVSSTPDIQGAALVSPDGLPLSSVLAANMDEERTAAMSAAMLSLGERIGQELERGLVERIFVEGEKGYSILTGCGTEAVLLVLASKAAKQGLLFLEIKRLVAELKPLFA